MTIEISSLSAVEILDSRSRPTLEVTAVLAGAAARAGVPSGASTGSREAVELRDGDPARYSGAGVLRAVENVGGEIAAALCGRRFADQAAVDAALIELDGTPTKSRLGANAVIGVSMAVARAAAQQAGVPLWRSLVPAGVEPARPGALCFNVLNGGVHAPNSLDFQEFMITPLGAPSVAEAVRAASEVYAALRRKLSDKGYATGLGDEGGFAPDISQPEEVLDLIVEAIAAAGYTPGRDGVAIALDPAASEFYDDDEIYLIGGEKHSSADLIERYGEILGRYPVWSIEDGLAEGDWEGWRECATALGERAQLVGDDILVTNPQIIAQAIEQGIANASLIKLNQIGTVTETLEAMRLCRQAGWAQMVSHRSGETPDTFIADLTVATGCGQLKTGAPARGERVAKYNRLIEIERAHPELGYARP